MRASTAIAALALALMPGLALAEGCHHTRPDQTAMSCAEGMVWDETKGICVLRPSS